MTRNRGPDRRLSKHDLPGIGEVRNDLVELARSLKAIANISAKYAAVIRDVLSRKDYAGAQPRDEDADSDAGNDSGGERNGWTFRGTHHLKDIRVDVIVTVGEYGVAKDVKPLGPQDTVARLKRNQIKQTITGGQFVREMFDLRRQDGGGELDTSSFDEEMKAILRRCGTVEKNGEVRRIRNIRTAQISSTRATNVGDYEEKWLERKSAIASARKAVIDSRACRQ